MRKRSEMVERSFAHVLDRGGMRRAWLRGRENVHKRYLIHVAGFNLGILMRALFGSGTPREAASAKSAILFVIQFDHHAHARGRPRGVRIEGWRQPELEAIIVVRTLEADARSGTGGHGVEDLAQDEATR